ncbi:acetyl-CoA carboxylase biotin carboxyl carrier protein subunit [Nocardioides ferulae]|uniref:acetyl-CoA carboxylase biotin carboxyl carrier protein subunit n=1 Tax=Nocardioides ferulae TaxID=2340821 RepID=UPI000EAC85EC|nr:acetyl-CoA carboxylase biotin carboxyl carrier protein subunit [Nocardioides ferulae]
MQLKVTVNGQSYDVEVEVEEEPKPTLGAIFMAGGSFSAPPAAAAPTGGDGDGVRAPLAGTVARIPVEEGQQIEAGAVLVVLEAMKMETEITAPEAGTVGAILVKPGDAVTGGQVLVELS